MHNNTLAITLVFKGHPQYASFIPELQVHVDVAHPKKLIKVIQSFICFVTELSDNRYGINAEPTNLGQYWRALTLHHLEILQRDPDVRVPVNVPNLQSFK